MEEALNDGRVSKVSTTISSSNEVIFTVPFFWEQTGMLLNSKSFFFLLVFIYFVEIDPIFSVLLDTGKSDQCRSDQKDGDNGGGVCITMFLI